MRLKLVTLTAAATLSIPTAALAQTPAHTAGKKPEAAKTAKPADAAKPAAAAKPADAEPQSTAPGQTGTTLGQLQTTPGEASQLTPAVTGTTPSGQTTATGQATASTKVDVKAGASVFDSSGASVGKIEAVEGNHAVLNTGTVKVKIPLTSLATGDKGLTVGMTKADIEAAAKGKVKTK
jgi:hypothetical protein